MWAGTGELEFLIGVDGIGVDSTQLGGAVKWARKCHPAKKITVYMIVLCCLVLYTKHSRYCFLTNCPKKYSGVWKFRSKHVMPKPRFRSTITFRCNKLEYSAILTVDLVICSWKMKRNHENDAKQIYKLCWCNCTKYIGRINFNRLSRAFQQRNVPRLCQGTGPTTSGL